LLYGWGLSANINFMHIIAIVPVKGSVDKYRGGGGDKYLGGGAAACFGRGLVATPGKAKEKV
jgi:hypothetical protein